jgi:hypothetical protein
VLDKPGSVPTTTPAPKEKPKSTVATVAVVPTAARVVSWPVPGQYTQFSVDAQHHEEEEFTVDWGSVSEEWKRPVTICELHMTFSTCLL